MSRRQLFLINAASLENIDAKGGASAASK